MTTHTAKFILRGEDKTKAAVASARRELNELKNTAFSLKGALAGGLLGFGLKEAVSHLVQANIDMQRVHFTLEAALGSSSAANKEFGFLAKTSNELGTNLREGAKGFSLLAASAQATHIPIKTIEDLYAGLSKQFTILHSSTSQQNRSLLALDEIMSMGVAHSRQLRRQLAMALAGSGLLPKLMDKLGMNPQQFEKAMKADQLTAQRIIPAIAAVLNDVNPTALHDATHSLNSDLNRLYNTLFTMQNNVGQQGFLSGVEDAIISLTKTLKDPGVQQGLGELAKDLGSILSLSAHIGADAAGGLDLVTQALGGFSKVETAPLRTGKTLAEQAKIAKSEMAKLAPVIQNIEHPGILSDQNFRNFFDYRGQNKRLQGLLTMYQNYGRELFQIHMLEQKYGAGASFLNPSSALMTNLVSQIQKAYHKANPDKSHGVEAQRKKITAILDTLKKEASTYGLTADQLKLYELRQLHASAADIKAANASIADRRAKQDQAQAVKDNARALKKEQTATQHLTDSLNAEMDPLRKYRKEQMQLDIALQDGLITKKEYVRYTAQIQADMAKMESGAKKTGDTLNQFSVKAARNMQDILGNTIMDVFSGKGNVFQNFAESFTHMIEQVIAQLLALQAAKKLFGNDFATGKSNSLGGVVGGIISFFSSQKGHSGAIIGSPNAATTSVSPLAFAGAPSFHSGGLLGLKPNEVPFVGLKGEEVLNESDPRHSKHGGRGGHMIRGGTNVFAPHIAIDASGAGPTEYANFMNGAHRLRQQLHRDYEHFHQFGDWPE